MSRKYFKVLLHGENFWMLIDDEVTAVNFFATRYVIAGNREDATNIALDSMWKDESLSARKNPPDIHPTIAVDRIDEVSWLSYRFRKTSGFTFYTNEDEEKRAH